MKEVNQKILNCYKKIAERFHELEKNILYHFNINSSYHKVIIALDEYGELSQTELSDKCFIDKPATSRIINKMTDEGYILKSNKANNKKNIYVRLTAKSKNLSKKIKGKLLQLKSNFFEELSSKDEEQFLSLLKKVIKKEVNNA
jgi:DNA-binding MarR family transcriptional regulator